MADSVDLRQLTPENLDLAIQEWVKLDKLVDPKHPRFPEYLKLSAKAKASYTRLKDIISRSGGLGDIDATISGLNALYEEALVIRGEMAADGMKKDLKIPEGASFEGEIDQRLDAAFAGVDEGYRSTIERDLLPMLYGLNVNPARLRQGPVPENYYYFANTGLVDFDKVAAAKKKAKELRDAGAVAPGLLQIASLLETGIARIESIEPGRAAAYKQYEEDQARKAINTKLPRLVGAVGAGLITVFGLTQFLWASAKSKDGEGPEFSPLIAGWAAVTMACINPKIFLQSGSSKVLAKIKDLGQPETRKVIGGGFTDPEALTELQELRGQDSTLLTDLAKLDKLTVAQVEGLTGSTDSALTKTLVAMDEKLRPAALRQLGIHAMDSGEIEIAQTFMKVPGAANS